MNPQTATMYIWENNEPFDIGYLTFILGGQQAPTERELGVHRIGNPMYCVADFRIYPVSKKADAETRKKPNELQEFYPHFKTILLEQRLGEYGLILPDHEIRFMPRGIGNVDGVDVRTIRAAAAHLLLPCYWLDILAVPGTSIEQDQLLASERIAEALGIDMVPQV